MVGAKSGLDRKLRENQYRDSKTNYPGHKLQSNRCNFFKRKVKIMEKSIGEIAKKLFSWAGSETPDPYVLTLEQEQEVIKTNCERLRDDKFKRYINLGMSVSDAENKALKLDYTGYIEKNKYNWFKQYNNSIHAAAFHKDCRAREREAEKTELESKKKIWTANNIVRLIEYNFTNKHPGKKFITTGPQLLIIKAVAYRLSEDERYKTELGFSFKKGLFIRSAVGMGKTDTVVFASDNGLNPVNVRNLPQIAMEIKSFGAMQTPLFKGAKMQLLDEVGREPVVKYYGTEINWFQSFVENMYANSPQTFANVILTSNFNDQQLTEKYGIHVMDRLKECFNFLDITGGESLRIN
jgi:hypothetical protein